MIYIQKEHQWAHLTGVFNMYGHALRLWLALLRPFLAHANRPQERQMQGTQQLFLSRSYYIAITMKETGNPAQSDIIIVQFYIGYAGGIFPVCYFLQFDNMDTYDRISALAFSILSICCNTCAIFYYLLLNSSCSNTLNFRSSRKSPKVPLSSNLTIPNHVEMFDYSQLGFL